MRTFVKAAVALSLLLISATGCTATATPAPKPTHASASPVAWVDLNIQDLAAAGFSEVLGSEKSGPELVPDPLVAEAQNHELTLAAGIPALTPWRHDTSIPVLMVWVSKADQTVKLVQGNGRYGLFRCTPPHSPGTTAISLLGLREELEIDSRVFGAGLNGVPLKKTGEVVRCFVASDTPLVKK